MPQASEWTDVLRSWRPPGEIAGQGPRAVRLTGCGIALMILSLLMFAGAIAVDVFLSRKAARESATRAALDSGSVETQATVTRHWRTGGKSDTPMIAYRFEHGGRIYHGSTSVPRAMWSELQMGSPIAVRFVPTEPEINHPSDWAVEVMPRWTPVGVASIFALTGVLPMIMVRRQTRLLSDGRAAPARVTGFRRVKQAYTILYEFPLPGGGTRKGRGGRVRIEPQTGSLVTVLYDPENPKRNAPYPLELARIDR